MVGRILVKRVLARSMEHQEDSMVGKRESCATENTKYCHGQFDCLYPKTLAKRKRKKNTQISKNNNLEVKAEFDDSIKFLNHDRVNVVNTNSLFYKTDLMT